MSRGSRVFLITGATGQQGGAVMNALIAEQQASQALDMILIAVTRDGKSLAAKKLAEKSPIVRILEGNLNKITLLEDARRLVGRPITGIFSVQSFGISEAEEEFQGKTLIDQAILHKVPHFVYTSVDRGGNANSWSHPTPVPHFRSKHNIEVYLREKTAALTSSMSWTILRPVAFMDNWGPNFQSRVFFAALAGSLGLNDKKLQLIAVKDIGIFGARALLDPTGPAFKNEAIGLAGDEMTVNEMLTCMRRLTTNPITPTFRIFGRAFTSIMTDLGAMVKWFGTDGYGVDIRACREIVPSLLNTEAWIKSQGPFELK